MKHLMNLNSAPFEMIESGAKTIELRLNDEKRQKIKAGDEIEFVNTEDSGRRLCAKVIRIHKFQSFEQLYKELPLLKCGYTEADIDTAKPDDMNMYYSKERQNQYGVLGIEIEVKET